MQQRRRRRHQHRQRREAQRPELADHRGAARQVERVADARGEHQAAADEHVARIAEAEVVHEGEADAGIAEHQRDQFAAAERFALEDDADEDGERRIGEQDQPFEAGRDVLQAHEVEQARAVVAEAAEGADAQPVAGVERRLAGAPGQADPEEGGQREKHAQRQQRDRIDAVGIGELDEDRLEREAERRDQRQQHAPGSPAGEHDGALSRRPGGAAASRSRKPPRRRRAWRQ